MALKEFSGDLIQEPKLKEFSGELDAPDSQGNAYTNAYKKLWGKLVPNGNDLRDVAAATLKIGPTALKGVGDLAQLVTGGNYGTGISNAMTEGMQAIDDVVGSPELRAQKQNVNTVLNDPTKGIGDLASAVIDNPRAAVDAGVSTIGSLFLPAGAAKAVTLIPKAANSGKAATAAAIGTGGAMNAADTFTSIDSPDLGDKYSGAAISGLTSLGVGALTGGGAEGLIAKKIANDPSIRQAASNVFARLFGQPLKTMGKEGLQEAGEASGNYLGEVVGDGKEFNANQLGKRAAYEGALGAILGGGVGAATNTGGQPPGITIIGNPAPPPANPQAAANVANLIADTATMDSKLKPAPAGIELTDTVQPTQDQPVDLNVAPTPDPTPATDDKIIQNRNRATPSSIAQMTAISAAPDYNRLSFSRDFANGAPVVAGGVIPAEQLGASDVAVASDGRRIPVQYAVVDASELLPSNQADGTENAAFYDNTIDAVRAIAGNGRIAGLQAAYGKNTADAYRTELEADTLHGIDPQVIAGMANPVLVRVMPQESVTADIGDVSNTVGNLELSPVEQANNDVQRVNLEALSFAEDGSVTPQAVRQFVQAMPQAEQGSLLDTNGQPTKQAVDRLNAAIFAKAYNNDKLIRLYAQAQDAEARIVLSALAQVAPKMARLEGAGQMDIRQAVTDAAEIAVNARRNGLSITRAAQQVDITADPNVVEVLTLFAANVRSSKAVAEALGRAADFAYSEAIKPAEDMFGEVPKASRQEVFNQLRNADEPTGTQDLPNAQGASGVPQDPARATVLPGGQGDANGAGAGGSVNDTTARQDAASYEIGTPPAFETYADAMAWVDQRAKTLGLSNRAYTASEEYKSFYPQLKALYDAQRASSNEAKAKALKDAGLAVGDRVQTTVSGMFMGGETHTGTIGMRGGRPVVFIDRPMTVASGGRVRETGTINWDARWGKQANGDEILSSYSETDIRARRTENERAQREAEARDRAEEAKRQADLERDTFGLTGSESETDRLEAQGQGRLFQPTAGYKTNPEALAAIDRAYGGRPAYNAEKASGKTELSYDDWLLVRTPAFREVFGNWEALRAQKKLDAMTPIKINVPDVWRGLDIKTLRGKVEAELLAIAESGVPLRNNEIGDVEIAKRGIGKAMSASADPAKLLVLGDIRNAFESSILASTSLSDQAKPNVVGYEKLLANVEIDGHDLIALFTIERLADGRQFYNSVTLEGNEKTPAASPRDTPEQVGERATLANTGVSGFIRRQLDRVNQASINGEINPRTGEPANPGAVNIAVREYSSQYGRQLDFFLDYGPDQSQAGAAGEAAQREAVSAVDDLRSSGSVLGKALSSAYATGQRVTLVGQRVDSAEDLATLAQVYRDPRFETFRLIFVNDAGRVVSQIGLTSRLPASTQAIIGDDADAYLKDVSAIAKSRGATRFWMLHNHPSGIAKPSNADINLTRYFSEKMPGLSNNGHVVIDTNEYSEINAFGDHFTNQKDFGAINPMTAGEFTGFQIKGADSVMELSKRLNVDDGAVTLITVSAQMRVLRISTIPTSMVSESDAANHRTMLKEALASKGMFIFAVSRDMAVLEKVGKFAMDGVHIANDGSVTTLNLKGKGGELDLFPDSRRTRLSPDSSNEFDYLRKAPTEQEYVAARDSQAGETGAQYEDGLSETKSTNRAIDAADLLRLRREAAGIEDPERGITFQITEDGQAIVRGPADTRVPDRFAKFAEDNGLTLSVRRNQFPKGPTRPMPLNYRESGATYFGENYNEETQPGFSTFVDRTGKTAFEDVAPYGADRPSTNSDGRQIHHTTEGVRNFWRWFGDSKAGVRVNAETGRPAISSKESTDFVPAVMYHTTRNDFSEFEIGRITANSGTFGDWETYRSAIFVTPELEASQAYGKTGGKFDLGANVMPLYAKAENPLDLTSNYLPPYLRDQLDEAGAPARLLRDFSWATFDDADGKAFVKAAKALGYDSAIFNDENPSTGESFEAWAIFSPEQIKSASGNNGDFGPANASVVRQDAAPYGNDNPQAAMELPAPGPRFDPIRTRDWFSTERAANGQRQYAAGRKLWDRAAGYANEYLGKLKLADTKPGAFKEMLRQFNVDKTKASQQAKRIAETGMDLTPEQRAMLSDLIEKQSAMGDVPPQEIVDLAATMTAALDVQARELVDLGMLSEDRLVKNYLPRLYKNGLAGMLTNPTLMRSWFAKARMRIRGDRLKSRGMFAEMPVSQVEQAKKLGWKVSGMMDGAPLPDDLLKGLETDNIPGKYADAKIVMWRDYTQDEREQMGEIRDGVLRYALGYVETQKDIAIGRLFKAIASNSDLAKDHNPGGWVKVPDQEIKGAPGTKAYGVLSGMWVEPQVADSLKRNTQPKGVLMAAYDKALSFWKEGKTVWNPVAHGNNVVSNLFTIHFAGINPTNPKAWRETLREYRTKGKYYNEALDNGLFGNEWANQEIQDLLMPDFADMASLEDVAASRVSKVIDLAKKAGKPVSWYREKMQKAYEFEDQFFKLMLYIDRRKAGMDPQEAITDAERYVFNYADIPEGVELIKRTASPFFAYTYKAIPMVLHTAMTRPDRMLAPIALLGGANWLAYMILGADEEEERKAMPEYMKGRTFIGTQKAIRLPFNIDDRPAFLDMSRRVPLGDLFDINNQTNGLPIPAPFMPSHPVLSMLQAVVYNQDTFTGRDLVKKSDTGWEAAQARAGYMVRQFMPNAPFVPGSYNFNKLADATAYAFDTEIGPYTGYTKAGDPVRMATVLPDVMTGTKIRSFDPQRGLAYQAGDLDKEEREIRANIRSAGKNKAMTEEARQRYIEGQQEKLRRLGERRAELNE